MLIVDVPVAVFSWLGRQGTRAVAALVVIGIALPSIGAILKPHVAEAVFLLLCIAFVRVDVTAFKAYISRPAIVLAATAWTSFAVPVIFGVSCLAAGLNLPVSNLSVTRPSSSARATGAPFVTSEG